MVQEGNRNQPVALRAGLFKGMTNAVSPTRRVRQNRIDTIEMQTTEEKANNVWAGLS